MMQKHRSMPLSSSISSLILLLHASSICAKNEFNKRTTQGNVEQLPSPVETVVIDHSSFTVDPNDIVIGHTTIVPTLPAVTVDHAAISVDKSNNVYINGSEAIIGTLISTQTTGSQNSSGLSSSYAVTSPLIPSGSLSLLGSPIVSPTGAGFHWNSNVSSSSDSELAGSGTAPILTPSESFYTGSGTASTSSTSSETSRSSIQSGLLVPPKSVSQSVPANSPNATSNPFETDVSLSLTPGAASASQVGSDPGTGITTTSPSQSQLASAIARNATASITSRAKSTPAPGSIVSTPGPSATSSSAGVSAPSGSPTETSGSSSATSFDVPNTTQAGGIPITSFPSSGPAASSQKSIFGGILLGFVSDGRSWVSDITLPAIKTQAINEIENLKGNTENAIRNLGGPFPPTSNDCSSGASKRSFDPIGTVEGLAGDALGLANCVDNILTDISSEIGPITGPPPPQDVIGPISTLLNAIEKAGEEEEKDNDDPSTTSTESSNKGSTSISSSSNPSKSSAMSSLRSSASSVHSTTSQSSSQTSSAVSGCPSLIYPDDDIEQWEGPSLDGNVNKRAFGIRGRWYRRPHQVRDQNDEIEESLDRRHELTKRLQGAAITEIKDCDFPNGLQVVQPGYSNLGAFKGLNNQPNGNNGRNAEVYNAVPKWYVGDYSCHLPNGFAWHKTDDKSPEGIPSGSKQSIDHVYEKQLVKVFLETMINTPTFTCADMEKVFFDGCGGINLMQTIFNQLPGMQFSDQTTNNPPLYENTNPGFAGLESFINGVKGYMFNKGIDPPSGYFQDARLSKGPQMQIQTVQEFIMLFGIMRDEEFVHMFDVTNDRIYRAYQTVDQRITSQNIQRSDGSGPIEANFATTYKTWLEGYLTDIVKPAWSWCSDTVTSIETSLNGKTDDASVAQIKLLNKINASPGFAEDRFTIDWSLSWSTGTLSRRDLTTRQESSSNSTDAACASNPSGTALSRSTTGLGSASGTASSVVTGTSSITPSISAVTVPVSTSIPATIEPTVTSAIPSATFSCTYDANAMDSDFPCLCDDIFYYCTNNGRCDWTTSPAAENCCMNCM